MLVFPWMADLHEEHRHEVLDALVPLDEAETARWVDPVARSGEELDHGPALVWRTDRSWSEVSAQIESDGYAIEEFASVCYS